LNNKIAVATLGTIKEKYQRKVTNLKTLHYINADGIKITVYSSYEVMVKEMMSLGINPFGKTIKELQIEISQICMNDYMKANFGEDSGEDFKEEPKPNNSDYVKTYKWLKNIVITYHLKELSYWLYDYNANKMPENIKFDFEINQKWTIR